MTTGDGYYGENLLAFEEDKPPVTDRRDFLFSFSRTTGRSSWSTKMKEDHRTQGNESARGWGMNGARHT